MMRTVLPAILITTSLNAQTTFQRVIDCQYCSAYAMSSAEDGSLFMASYFQEADGPQGIQVVKHDGNANAEWGMVVRSGVANNYIAVKDIAATNDGGAVLAGFTYVLSGRDSAYVAKLSGSGDILWSRTFKVLDDPDVVCRAWRVAEAPNGDIIVGGHTVDHSGSPYHGDIFLARFDPEGTLVWNRLIMAPIAGTNNEFGDLLILDDGSIVIVAQTVLLTEGSWLMKLNLDGYPIWTQRYDTNAGLDLVPFHLSRQGTGYVVLLHRRIDGPNVLYRIATDQNGELTSSQRYQVIGDDGRLESAVERTTDGLAVAGHVNTTQGWDALLVLLDASGNIDHSISYGSPGAEGFGAVGNTVDGGYFLAGLGQVDSLLDARGGLPTQIYEVKTDGNGNSFGCETPMDMAFDLPGFTSAPYTQNVADTSAWNNTAMEVQAAYSETAVCSALGVGNAIDADPRLQVYPNPANDRITLSSSLPIGIVRQMYLADATGRAIRNYHGGFSLDRTNRYELVLPADLPNGRYVVCLTTDTTIMHALFEVIDH